jgi:hypothetical protein
MSIVFCAEAEGTILNQTTSAKTRANKCFTVLTRQHQQMK